MLTLLEMLNRAAGYLKDKAVETPRVDAEVLLADLLGLDRVDLYVKFERPVELQEQDAYRDRIRRRAAFEPVAYITGKKEFWSLPLEVGPGVLIPRPDTETLVEAALDRAQTWKGRVSIADVGTGSGAIALALAKELPDARIVASDPSAVAQQYLDKNAKRLGLMERVSFVEGAGMEPLVGQGPFTLIVSNPPYIASAELEGLQSDVKNYEPSEALDGGPDGLDVIRALVSDVGKILEPGGWFLVEHGVGASQEVCALLNQTQQFEEAQQISDLSGKNRVVAAKKT